MTVVKHGISFVINEKNGVAYPFVKSNSQIEFLKLVLSDTSLKAVLAMRSTDHVDRMLVFK